MQVIIERLIIQAPVEQANTIFIQIASCCAPKRGISSFIRAIIPSRLRSSAMDLGLESGMVEQSGWLTIHSGVRPPVSFSDVVICQTLNLPKITLQKMGENLDYIV